MKYSELTKPQKAKLILKYLKEDYPTVRTPLVHRNAFELLIGAILSPQTTDQVTNKITAELFKTYDSPGKLAGADYGKVLNIIRSTNYNKTKAGRIIKTAQMLVADFDNKVPHTMEKVLSFPGVGRKVANVVLGDWYATPEEDNPPYPGDDEPNRFNSIVRGSVKPTGIVVDTHVARVSNALQLVDTKNPEQIERELMALYPPNEWMGLSLRLIFHGREVFQARNPKFKDFSKWERVYTD